MPSPASRRLTYIDLFAGCGGLALGIERSGPAHAGFELVFAVEKSEMAAETFFHNFIKRIESDEEWQTHLQLPVPEQAADHLVVSELTTVLADRELLAATAAREIDLVVGGPPCQGFSIAGKRNPDDPRNELPWQFLDFVAAVRPRAVVIENVAGINQGFAKHGRPAAFTQLAMQLERTGEGYIVQRMQLNAQDFGVPQHRSRMVLVAIRRDVAERSDITGTGDLWSGGDKNLPLPPLVPVPSGGPRPDVEEALWDIGDRGYTVTDRSRRYLKPRGKYARMMRFDRDWFAPTAIEGEERPPTSPSNHRLTRHTGRTRRRFRLYQYLDRVGISAKVLSVHRDAPEFVAIADSIRVCLEEAGNEAPFPWVMPSGDVIACSTEDVIALVRDLHTKKHSQRPLRGSEPARTVLTLPDDFVHYREPRIHTVREFARFQSFPDSFVFRSKESTGSHRRRIEVPQYTQVGNAVPPLLASAIGDRLYEILVRVEVPVP